MSGTVPVKRVATVLWRSCSRTLSSALPVAGVTFHDESANTTSIVGDGQLSFPDFPKVDAVTIRASDEVELGDLQSFYLRSVDVLPSSRMKLSFDGVVGQISTGPGANVTDRRLSEFDMLSNNQRVLGLFGVLCWISTTAAGLRKYLKDHAS